MKKLKRLYFDLIHPNDWYIVYKIKDLIWKIKDYDRLQYDYSCVLCHATWGRMSYTNYELNIIYSEIDDIQSQSYYKIVKDDINDIIKNAGTIEDIQEYIDNL